MQAFDGINKDSVQTRSDMPLLVPPQTRNGRPCSKNVPFLYNRLGPVTQGIITAMCGRFTLYSSINNLKKVFDIDTVTCEMEASYNIAPGDEVCAIIRGKDNRLGKLHWGLVPTWAKNLSGASGLINARAETLQESQALKELSKKDAA